MRSSSLARVVMASLGVSVVFTLGCNRSQSRGGPSDIPGPQPGPSTSQRAALALFEAASLHRLMTTSPLTSATYYGQVWWTNGPCEFAGQGSLQATLDGGLAPTSGTFLPTGSHTYVVSFSNCLVDGWAGRLNGVASAAYNAADWNNVTATVSADSVRGRMLASNDLSDVTADGSAVWTRVGLESNSTTETYTPATGSRLVNNLTTNVATFGGGAYSTIPTSERWERRFDNLKVAINGTEYTLNGSLYYPGGSTYGEVRITNNGTLVARIYGGVGDAPSVEVLVPLGPF